MWHSQEKKYQCTKDFTNWIGKKNAFRNIISVNPNHRRRNLKTNNVMSSLGVKKESWAGRPEG